MRSAIQQRNQLTHRIREQARSHRFLQCSQNLSTPQTTVGAGLLAIAAYHPTSKLTDPPLSPAGWLPHFFCDDHRLHARRRSLWELACKRMRSAIQHRNQLTHRYRLQAICPEASGVSGQTKTARSVYRATKGSAVSNFIGSVIAVATIMRSNGSR